MSRSSSGKFQPQLRPIRPETLYKELHKAEKRPKDTGTVCAFCSSTRSLVRRMISKMRK